MECIQRSTTIGSDVIIEVVSGVKRLVFINNEIVNESYNQAIRRLWTALHDHE